MGEREIDAIHLPAILPAEYNKIGVGGSEAAQHKRKRQLELLQAYVLTKNLPKACAKTGVDWQAAERWRASDTEYRKALKAVDVMIAKMIEAKEVDLALNGAPKGVYYEGQRIGEEREHDPRRAQTLLKAKLPEEYDRPQQLDIRKWHTADVDARLEYVKVRLAELDAIEAEFSVSDVGTPQGQDTPTPPVTGSPPPPQKMPPM